MRIVLGLDVGTTSLSCVGYDCDRREIVAQTTLENLAARYGALPGGLQAAELDLHCLRGQLVDALGGLVRKLPGAANVVALGVTGQQHGVALLNRSLEPIGNAITWQDQRTLLTMPGGASTWLQAFVEQAGGLQAFTSTGCEPAPGFMGPSLYWLYHEMSGFPDGALACLIPDVAVSFLTGLPPVTDVTDGASSGLLDIGSGDWAWEVIERLALPRDVFPPIQAAGTARGSLLAGIAEATGLEQIPVCVAAGDNQASFVGSMSDPSQGLLINVGTGGQISASINSFQRVPGVETRAFFGGRYLLVGAGLYGGRAYAYLQSLFQDVGRSFFGASGDEELFGAMNTLAAAVPPGCDGLRCLPLFTGTREDPNLRASFTGIGPTNLSPGYLARAVLEGITEGFYEQYDAMRSALGHRTHLVGAGNGLTRNPVLAEIVSRRFELPVHVCATTEAAALGAALLAADGVGELSLHEGISSITYDCVIDFSTGVMP